MSAWTLGGLLVAALLAGFAAGWLTCWRLGLRSPNAAISFLVLLTGSLGGPALGYHVLGSSPMSYALALLAAGFAAGATFWPMGERQGAREWL
jgi:hypothetical protein